MSCPGRYLQAWVIFGQIWNKSVFIIISDESPPSEGSPSPNVVCRSFIQSLTMSCRKTGPTSMGYLWTNLKQWKICECGNLWKSMSTFHHCLSDRFLYTGRQSGAPHLFCPALWPLSPLASFALFSGCNLLNSKTKYRNMMHFRRRGTWPGGSRETIREFNLLSNGAVESFWDAW